MGALGVFRANLVLDPYQFMSSDPTHRKRADAQGPHNLLDSLGQKFQTKWFQTWKMGSSIYRVGESHR